MIYKRSGCNTPIIREMQIKTIMWYHLILIKIATIKKTKITGVGEDLEKLEPLCTVGGNVKCYSSYGKMYDSTSVKYEISIWSSNKIIESRVWKIYISITMFTEALFRIAQKWEKPKCISFYLIFFLLYNIVLVLPYINMHLPRVYTCSPSWTPLPPPSPYHPSGSSQCTSPKLPVSCIEPGLAIRFLYDFIHVLMPFSQIIPPTHRVQKAVLYICVSFAVSHTGLSLPFF